MLRYLIAAVILLVGMTAQAAAQDEAELRAGVVKIVSTLDGKRRTGTGFAVKADGTSVYLVTAAHVIEGDPTPKVEFFYQTEHVGQRSGSQAGSPLQSGAPEGRIAPAILSPEVRNHRCAQNGR